MRQNKILRHEKELKIIEKKNQENENKEIKAHKNRELYLMSVENKKQLLLKKLDNTDKRIKKQKLEQEKKFMEKNNQLYMQREDRKLKIEQSERAKKFEREVLYSQIQERMGKLDDFMNEKYLLGEKRKQMEKQLSDEKEGMEDRMQKIMRHDEYFSRNEILNYVLNDKKPNLTNYKKCYRGESKPELRLISIPLLHSYVGYVTKNNGPSVIKIVYYTYSNPYYRKNPYMFFLSGSDGYELYRQEFRYLWEENSDIIEL